MSRFKIAILMLLVIGSTFIFVLSKSYAGEYGVGIAAVDVGANYRLLKAGITPIKVEISNYGGNFSGEVQVLVDNDNNKHYAIHSMEVFVPGYSNEKYILNVPIEIFNESIVVILVKDGKILSKRYIELREDEYFEKVGHETPLIGVIDNRKIWNISSKTVYKYLAGIELPVTMMKETNGNRGFVTRNIEAKIFNLGMDHLYKDALSYSSFNVLIINDFNPPYESNENSQYQAINKWVLNGGMLIINKGGSAWDLIQNEDENIISENIDTLSKYVDEESPITSGENVLDFNGNVLVASKKHGYGIICQTTFDLTSEPFVSWKGNAKFIEKLIKLNMKVMSENAYNKYGYREGQNITPKKVVFELIKMDIILTIFVLIIGLILLIILKRINRREISFIIVPAVLFVVIVGFYEFGDGTPIVNNVSVIELFADNI